eukprot:1974636-Amphidinium_carterae.2
MDKRIEVLKGCFMISSSWVLPYSEDYTLSCYFCPRYGPRPRELVSSALLLEHCSLHLLQDARQGVAEAAAASMLAAAPSPRFGTAITPDQLDKQRR